VSDALLKVEGAGNDFVLGVGRWAEALGESPGLVRRLCDRRRGVGADGALAVWRVSRERVRLRYRNADGGEARFCANGTRCAAGVAHRLLGVVGELVVATAWEDIPARVEGSEVELTLPAVDPPREIVVEREGHRQSAWLLQVGVPHLVIAVADLDTVDLATEGPRLRALPVPDRDGSNVHLVTRTSTGIRLRSWERGVEGETWCCGSGVVAAALLDLAATGDSRVDVRPRSGDLLAVAVSGGPFGVPVRASGPVRVVARLEPDAGWLSSADEATGSGD
jgi:diaminopimelate epimerase